MAIATSGQVTVASAGTAVQGPATQPGLYWIKAHPGNTGDNGYVGNDGSDDVSSSTGFALGKTHPGIQIYVTSLEKLWFDVDTGGDIICWIYVGHPRA
jgi:hypothetical protein